MKNPGLLPMTLFFTVLCLFSFADPGGGGPVAAWGVTVTRATAAEPEVSKVEREGQAVPEVRGPRPDEVRINPQDGERYVWIPPGNFQMGCSPDDRDCRDHEKPRHRVTISRGFWMGQTEVTVGGYRKFAQATQRKVPEALVLAAPPRFRSPDFPQSDNHPVAYVTWDEAAQYCQWAGGRLPTEAEWEYAARAGSPAARYGNLDEIAWYADNSGRSKLDSAELWGWESASRINYRKRLRDNGKQTHPVGKKTPNDFGLYDMLGNVLEWCADWYGEKYYQVSEERDPEGPPSGEFRVMRGADWYGPPWGVRVSTRDWMLPDHRFSRIGFRCVREVIP